MYKKLTAIITLLTLVLTSCTKNDNNNSNTGTYFKPTILYVAYDTTDPNSGEEIYVTDGTNHLKITNYIATQSSNDFRGVILSKDKKQIAFGCSKDNASVMSLYTASFSQDTGTISNIKRLTFPTSINHGGGFFSLDGSRIYYTTGGTVTKSIKTDGSDDKNESLYSVTSTTGKYAVSYDFNNLVWSESSTTSPYPNSIYYSNFDGTNKKLVKVFSTSPYVQEISTPKISPDKSKIVFALRKPSVGNDIFIVNADGTLNTQLTNFTNNFTVNGISEAAEFSSDGSKIYYLSNQQNVNSEYLRLYKMNLDGTSKTLVLDLGKKTITDFILLQ